MDATPLKKYIQSGLHFTNDELETITHFFTTQQVEAKTVLLREGAICDFEAFVLKGCLKVYFVNNLGTEVVVNFASENWWVSDVSSFEFDKPSRLFIETIEPSTLLVLNPQSKKAMLAAFPSLEHMFRIMLQRHVATFQDRLFAEHAQTAEQRYDAFIEKYANLVQRVPQYAIASYLGISAEFLSRLRKRKSIS
jgi:CRP/FNR family transcriptional regulator, cyclic AMP receptor protein